MRFATFAAAGLAALTASAALAQDGAAPDPYLAAIDSDSSGTITEAEFIAVLHRAFAELDSDTNGFVTWAEAEGRVVREHFDALDANRDGRVSRAELETQARADFAASDKDGDGVLD